MLKCCRDSFIITMNFFDSEIKEQVDRELIHIKVLYNITIFLELLTPLNYFHFLNNYKAKFSAVRIIGCRL